MIRIAQTVRYRLLTQHADNSKEGAGREQREKSGLIDALRIVILAVRKSKEPRLHAVCQNHQQQRRPCVQVRDDTIVVRPRQHVGVERHKQIIQELPDDTAQPVDGGVLRQGFHL